MSVFHDLGARWLRGQEPERAHELTIKALKSGLGPKANPRDPVLETTLAGIRLPNPIGLAPGFDKNAEVFAPMLAAGFGFVECGTVTPRPQEGNPRPRLFRLSEDDAVINRMGFNNEGLEAFAARLTGRGRGVVGANVGANKDSEDRIADYVTGVTRLWGLCDYLTINISSPNTPGLRALQTREALEELLGRIAETRARLPARGRVPMFLKVAPDLEDAEIEAIVETAVDQKLEGIIVSNTTLARDGLRSPLAQETGGLSGAPLFERSTQVLRSFNAASEGRLVLIGVGGVGSGEQAYAKIRAGASAVQLYSALVYEGPGLVSRIARDLAKRLKADGFLHVAEAVGAN
ncbi:MAG TPA: quinone-dependent dihydroorotate dehydrogenase [Phenylobacterium sp.]